MYTYLSQKQADNITRSASKRDALLIKLLLETGCTANEATGLRTADISENSVLIQDREIQLPRNLCSQLRKIAGSEYVFCTRQSPQLSARRVQQIVRTALRKAGVEDATPQMLRYTHIKQRLDSESLEQIAERLDLCMQRLHIVVGGLQPQIRETDSFTLPASGRDNLLVSVLQHTAATAQQISSLKATDLHKETLVVAGNEHQLPAPLAKALHELIDAHSSEYIFCTRQSPQLSARRVQQIVKKTLKKLDVQKTAQDLRYDWIASRAQQGMRPGVIAQAIGLSTQRIEEILGRMYGGAL